MADRLTAHDASHAAPQSVLRAAEDRPRNDSSRQTGGGLRIGGAGRNPDSRVLWWVVGMAVGGCTEEPLTRPAAVREPTTIVVTPTEARLEVPDGAVQLSAEVLDQHGTKIAEAVVGWSSADSTVATVSDSGLVAAARTGNTDVTARHAMLEASASIAVVGATVIVVTPTEARLEVPGGTVQLSAEVLDQDGASIADAVVEWSSADSMVANVSNSGLVAAVDTGSTHVTARHATLAASASIAVVPDVQRSALAAFYEETGGPGWKRDDNWLSEAPLGRWWGINVEDSENVQKLSLVRNGLRGSIPPEVGRLSHLEHLYLQGNNLSGSIPPEIASATGLNRLLLSDNPLEGLLPPTMLRLHLWELDYRNTELCVPRSPSFTQWIETLEYHDPEPCSPTRHDRFVLTEIYDALGGPDWTRQDGWRSDLPLDRWDGVGVDANGRVVSLSLGQNRVEGELPRSLGYLEALRGLDLHDNPGLAGALREWMLELRLDSLYLSGATLCVPPGPRFDEWLNGVQDGSWDRCGEPSSIRTTIPVVYLVQTAQDRRGGVPLVAGRDALLRVFAVADETNYFDSDARAQFYKDGHVVHTAMMTVGGRRGIPLQVDERGIENSLSALIPGEVLVPGVTLVVDLDPERSLPLRAGSQFRVPEVGQLALDVREMPVMELTVVPVRFAGDDPSVPAPGSQLRLDSPALKGFRTLLPIHEVDFSVREPITVSSHDGDALAILSAVHKADGASGYYIGISRNPGGLAELGGKVSVSELDPLIIAHEIGHNLGLRHARCGQSIYYVDKVYPYGAARTGVWGYDSELAELKEPTYPDLMSYCRPAWISDYHFTKALEHRERTPEGRAGELGRGGGDRTRTLLLWGRITERAGVLLEPAVVLDAVPSVPDGAGPYRIAGTSDSGEILFSLNFTPNIAAHDGDGHFAFTVPIEAAWDGSLARITVSGPAGSDSLDRATRRPLVIVVDPASGRIRSMLRDFEATPPVAGDSVKVSYGLPAKIR